jgi:hypothetical protein
VGLLSSFATAKRWGQKIPTLAPASKGAGWHCRQQWQWENIPAPACSLRGGRVGIDLKTGHPGLQSHEGVGLLVPALAVIVVSKEMYKKLKKQYIPPIEQAMLDIIEDYNLEIAGCILLRNAEATMRPQSLSRIYLKISKLI